MSSLVWLDLFTISDSQAARSRWTSCLFPERRDLRNSAHEDSKRLLTPHQYASLGRPWDLGRHENGPEEHIGSPLDPLSSGVVECRILPPFPARQWKMLLFRRVARGADDWKKDSFFGSSIWRAVRQWIFFVIMQMIM